MIQRRATSLLLWFFVVLQVMTPFIHAHADGMQFCHTGFLHVYEDLVVEVASPLRVGDQHGMEIVVEQGRPYRIAAPAPTNDVRSAPIRWPSCADAAVLPGAGLPAPPGLPCVAPAYVHPLALAPPLA